MLSEIFSTDRKLWTGSQCDQASLFFQYNPFFSKFYQKQDFQNLIGMCYYTKVQKKSSLILQNKKKPQAIILLSGKVDIFKKVYRQKVRKIKKTKNDPKQSRQIEIFVEYQLFKSLTQQSQTVNLDFDCRVSALDDQDAEILYVPAWIYEQHIKIIQNRKTELIFKELLKFYPKVQRKSLINLAKHGCSFKQLKINDYVYKVGSLPLEVYFLLQGTIRLQKQKILHNRLSIQAVNVQSPSIFGDKDIKLLQRYSSAIVCSAYAKILAINKKQFLRFLRQNHLSLSFEVQSQDKDYRLPLLKSKRNSFNFFQQQEPKIARFRSSNQIIENEKLIEMKLMKDSHILVNLSPKKSRTSRFDSNKNDNSKDYTKDQFQQKMRLFHKIRPNAKKIDLNNPIINLVQTRGYTTFRNSLGNLSD